MQVRHYISIGYLTAAESAAATLPAAYLLVCWTSGGGPFIGTYAFIGTYYIWALRGGVYRHLLQGPIYRHLRGGPGGGAR
jgi:hypothetical protein